MPQYNPNDYDPNDSGFMSLPEGDYMFTIVSARNATSKAGNEMIELELACDVGQDKDMTTYDRLVFTAKALFRIAKFCAGVGLDFDTGSLSPDDCLGRTGKAHLTLGEANIKGKRYMEVAWYCEREGYREQPASTNPPPTNPPPTNPPPTDPPPTDPQLAGQSGPTNVVSPHDDIPF